MGNNTNVCLFDGNLTRDPEITTFETGSRVCRFAIAINKFLKDNKKDTQYVEFEAWNEKADILKDLKKGDWIFVESEFKEDRWEKEGEKRKATRFNIKHFRDFQKNRVVNNRRNPPNEVEPAATETQKNGQDIPF